MRLRTQFPDDESVLYGRGVTSQYNSGALSEPLYDGDNKLFVGMLPKTFSEHNLSDIFGRFGMLHELHVIRGPDGRPKGCAFVKFVGREAALAGCRQA